MAASYLLTTDHRDEGEKGVCFLCVCVCVCERERERESAWLRTLQLKVCQPPCHKMLMLETRTNAGEVGRHSKP